MAITANPTLRAVRKRFPANSANGPMDGQQPSRGVFNFFASIATTADKFISFISGALAAVYSTGTATNAAAYSTGTVSNSAGGKVLTFVTSLLVTNNVKVGWILTFAGDETRYRVASVDTETQITLEVTVPNAHAGATFSLKPGHVTFSGNIVTAGVQPGWLLKFGTEDVYYTVLSVVSATVCTTLEPIAAAHAGTAFAISDAERVYARRVRFTLGADVSGEITYLYSFDGSDPGTPTAEDPSIACIGSSPITLVDIVHEIAACGVHVKNGTGVTMPVHISVEVM